MITPDLYRIPGPWRGTLAIAARPRGGDWLEDEFGGLRAAGIDIVVSLLEPNEAAELNLTEEAASAENQGILFLSFPIPDRGEPRSGQEAAKLIAAIAEALERGKTVAVHCRQGLGRSGLIAAAVLTTSGINADHAIQTISAARGQSVPETMAQRRWIEQFASRRPVAAP